MKQHLLLLTAFFIFHTSKAKSIVYPDLYQMPILVDGRKIPNVKPVLGNYLYFAISEVSNTQYNEFLNWVKINQTERLASMRPKLESLNGKEDNYLKNPAYKDYPVVGITQIQALAFCNWLHDRLQDHFKLEKIPIKAFKVRLPSEEEWIIAARGGQAEQAPYPWDGEDVRYMGPIKKNKGKFLLNCRMGVDANESMSPYDQMITTPVISYWPNNYGLYNICGNVAEWLQEDGLVKGGSWKMPPYNCRIDAISVKQAANYAGSDIGMRYVIEILEVEDKKTVENFRFNKKYFNEHFSYVPKVKSDDKLHFYSNEVSNLEYLQFLKETPKSEYLIQEQVWDEVMKYGYYRMYGKHSAFHNYPVVGISYKAALAYCTWLTEKFNQAEQKPYTKIIFRLPTEEEWTFAAHGGLDASYPWGGGFTRNNKGCYLANFSPMNEKYLFLDSNQHIDWVNPYGKNYDREADGSIIPVQTKTYFPNNYGLYNTSGNVAEMISAEGVSKGGSWLSNQYEIMLQSKGKYSRPSCDLGFRVLAEVLEE